MKTWKSSFLENPIYSYRNFRKKSEDKNIKHHQERNSIHKIISIPAGATRFVPAFKAGTRAQTMAPSGLDSNLSAPWKLPNLCPHPVTFQSIICPSKLKA